LNIYECNENQFIENVRRLIEAGNKLIINRTISLQDDNRYGLSILPEKEFIKYSNISYRKGYKHTSYAKVPFLDEFHKRLYNKDEILHSSSNLSLARLSIPYYKIEYSFNIWGSAYIYTFDILFEPEIVIEKRRVMNKNILIHLLRFKNPNEVMLNLRLPNEVIILDVKKLTRVF
jgi:hypothetical protein